MKLQYDPLLEATSEIRLVTLPPGTTEDLGKIQFRLWHTPLSEPIKVPSTRLTLREINETLPPGWRVHETNQYNYRYLFEQIETENTTWTHPDPTCDTKHWAPEMQLPPINYKPEYEALSYTWESAETPEIALVEYHSTTGNPKPKPEHCPLGKTWQKLCDICVARIEVELYGLMPFVLIKKIYLSVSVRLARRVVVWLGPASHDSDIAMSSLKYLGSQLEISSTRYRFRAPAALEPEWFRAMCPLPFSEKVWMAIGSLFERSWFERLWIWQEIQLANSNAIVACGKSELLWQDLRKAIIALFTKHELPTLHLRTRLDFIRTLTLEVRDYSFSVLTKISRPRGCMDPRDKIYGMLSLCNPRLAEKIETSYTKDLAEVYRDVFLHYSLQTRRLDLLLDCGLSLQLPGSPSWVPNWAIGRDSYPLYSFCWTSGISRSEMRYIAPNRLQVTGLEVFRVQTVTTEAPSHPSQTLNIIRCWEPSDLLTKMYVNGEKFLDAYCTTLRAGFLRERWPKNRVPSLEEWEHRYLAKVSSDEAGNLSQDSTPHVDIEWMLKIARGRVLMTTEDGYIGLGPSGTRQGDIICILLGCQQPIVLRPRAEADAFEVVGECYVDALENSVAILGPLPPHVRPQRRHASRGSSVLQTFLDLNTGLTFSEDPRLQALEECGDWESVPHDRNANNPEIFEYYNSKRTGENMNSDPRLLPSALQERGVTLRTFDLH